MADDVSEIPKWLKFFENAGLKISDATHYAMVFTEHRIKENMLGELTQDYLTGMGITAVGDMIAILRQARQQSSSSNGVSAAKEYPVVVQPVKASAAASRIINHCLSGGSTPLTNHNLRSAGNARSVYPVPDNAVRRNPSANGSKKDSVFSRLGNFGENSVKCKSTGNLRNTQVSKLKRTRGMVADRIDGSIVDDDDDDDDDDSNGPPLEYQGVLKYTDRKPTPRKVPAMESTQLHDKSPITQDLTTRAAVNRTTSAGIFTKTPLGAARTAVGGTRTAVGGTRTAVGETRTAVGGTSTAGILSLDAPAVALSAKQRLGSIQSSNGVESSSLR